MEDIEFLTTLERIVQVRKGSQQSGSYTRQLLQSGTRRIAQKVGEEAIELALAAAAGTREEQTAEAADLLYHFLVLLADRDLSLAEITRELESRHRGRQGAR